MIVILNPLDCELLTKMHEATTCPTWGDSNGRFKNGMPIQAHERPLLLNVVQNECMVWQPHDLIDPALLYLTEVSIDDSMLIATFMNAAQTVQRLCRYVASNRSLLRMQLLQTNRLDSCIVMMKLQSPARSG